MKSVAATHPIANAGPWRPFTPSQEEALHSIADRYVPLPILDGVHQIRYGIQQARSADTPSAVRNLAFGAGKLVLESAVVAGAVFCPPAAVVAVAARIALQYAD